MKRSIKTIAIYLILSLAIALTTSLPILSKTPPTLRDPLRDPLRSFALKKTNVAIAQLPPTPQSMNPQTAIERLFTTEQIQTDWFDSSFLNQVPLAQVQQIINNLKNELGNYQKVELEGNDYLVVFDRAFVPTKIALNQSGQIIGLFFQPPRSKAINLEDAVKQFQQLPGQVSFLVTEGKQDLVALNSTKPLAVGSTFKLAVLDALNSQIAAGKHSWQEVVQLRSSWKSLPSGFLQNWPDGALLTVQTLAALMISQSDNTATDSLINLVGVSDIEAIAPRNLPFLTTRQAFILKSIKNSGLLNRYRAGSKAERRGILQEVDEQLLPSIDEFQFAENALDVEWFFSVKELCDLMEKVASLPLMSINPGVANAKDWQRVAYKGGSEPGVLNLTTWLQSRDSKTYCISATWNNDKPLEEARFMNLYTGAIESLK